MRIVLQRVSRAEVRIDGRVAGRIGRGFLLLAGFHSEDSEEALVWMADKVIGLRLFPAADTEPPHEDAARPKKPRLDLGLEDVQGGLLVVSQFTLYGDARKGRRPDFTEAAPPEIAIPLYHRFIALLREKFHGPVETGEFGAMMAVDLLNDGPVTLILEK